MPFFVPEIDAMEKTSGTIFRIKKYALHDGPGIRTTIFLKGCPLACWWCHNPEGLNPRPEAMEPAEGSAQRTEIVGKEVSVKQVMAEIEKDTIFYDDSGGGATFSGGEPLLQPGFLQRLLMQCAEKEIHTVLDTSGNAARQSVSEIVPNVDMILFDLKIIDDERHRHYTGVSNRLILENLKIIARSGKPVHIRFPVIPGITDSTDNVRQVSETIHALGTIQNIDLLPYHKTADAKYRRLGMENKMAGKDSPSQAALDGIRCVFEEFGFQVRIGGE